VADVTPSTKLIVSESYDPWHNLALEEALLEDVAPTEIILYLWQNENTVVIGRNQNAWEECRWKELEADGGKLARRLSGGGAVYHDLGNLNFTFIMDRRLWDLHKQLEVILGAVRKLGVDAKFSGRNDIVLGDRKFSGNAFHTTADAAFHHGTLLVDVDFSKLGQYLRVSEDKIKSKGVTSVRSRVINLAEVAEEITVEAVRDAMRESFTQVYGGAGEELLPGDVTQDLTALYEKYSSWEWRFGRTPKFDVTYYRRFPWGAVDMGFVLDQGHIEACTIYSDAMDARLIMEIADHMEQIPFRGEAIVEKLRDLAVTEESRPLVEDMIAWIQELEV
jgi:lipoate-protein ligase A